MELKDLVLSTLEELEKRVQEEVEAQPSALQTSKEEPVSPQEPASSEEVRFLEHTKERLCLLFEGLHASEGDKQKQLQLTLKYLQYHLAQIEERLASLQKHR